MFGSVIDLVGMFVLYAALVGAQRDNRRVGVQHYDDVCVHGRATTQHCYRCPESIAASAYYLFNRRIKQCLKDSHP